MHHFILSCIIFQSTLPMRGETQFQMAAQTPHSISIHSPHAGRDRVFHLVPAVGLISIHSPHAGRDLHLVRDQHIGQISIHSPHAGRDLPSLIFRRRKRISIHSPHAGRDLASFERSPAVKFQSTLPMRGETSLRRGFCMRLSISIHSPHAGRDSKNQQFAYS